jgi:hypothetical protein
MSLLALLFVPLVQSTPADRQVARCAAVMKAIYDSRSDDRWDEDRALALAAASYYVGRIEASVTGMQARALVYAVVKNRFEGEYNKLKPQDVEAEGKKCFDDYTAAIPL